MDDVCPACRYGIDDYDIDGMTIVSGDGRLFTRLDCPHCTEALVYILDFHGDSGVVYECTWKNKPCGYSDCECCLTGEREEHNEKHGVVCQNCDYHLPNSDEWVEGDPVETDSGIEIIPIKCPECDSKEHSKNA